MSERSCPLFFSCMGELHLILQPGANELLQQCETGWIALFCGVAWGSLATQFYTMSQDSHVGVLVRVDENTPAGQRPYPADRLLLWEVVRGAHSSCYDYISGKERTQGARLVSFMERLEKSREQANVRIMPLRLTDSGPPAVRRRRVAELMWPFFVNVTNSTFDDSWVVLFNAAYDGPGGYNAPESKKLFCSDGVARALRVGGLVAETCNTREVTPADFEWKRLPFLDCYLDVPVLLAVANVNSRLLWRVERDCCECVIV